MLSLYVAKQDFHLPIGMLGRALDNRQKQIYNNLTRQMREVVRDLNPTEADFLGIVDKICDLIMTGNRTWMLAILSEVIKFLRIHFLSRSMRHVKNTVCLSDILVKNCGEVVHRLINQRNFMKTIALVARRFIVRGHTPPQRDLGLYLLDTIQAWGEAFEPYRQHYPHIFGYYFKLRVKYNMPFGPQYDSRRVPIFLGPIRARYSHTDQHLDFDNYSNISCLSLEIKEEDSTGGSSEKSNVGDCKDDEVFDFLCSNSSATWWDNNTDPTVERKCRIDSIMLEEQTPQDRHPAINKISALMSPSAISREDSPIDHRSYDEGPPTYCRSIEIETHRESGVAMGGGDSYGIISNPSCRDSELVSSGIYLPEKENVQVYEKQGSLPSPSSPAHLSSNPLPKLNRRSSGTVKAFDFNQVTYFGTNRVIKKSHF